MNASSIVPPVVWYSPRSGSATSASTEPIAAHVANAPRCHAPASRGRRPPEPPSTNGMPSGSSTGPRASQRRANATTGTRPTAPRTHSAVSAGARNRTLPYVYADVMVTLRNWTPERHQRDPLAAHRDGTDHRQPGEAVEHHQTHRAGVAIAPLDATEVHVLQRPEQLPLAQHPQRDDTWQFTGVSARVVEAERPPVQGDLRLVAGRLTLRIADALLTLEVPVADERPVVHGRAVGVDHHLVAVGRQRHELLERGRVADHPRRQHRETCEDRDGEVSPAHGTRQRARQQDPRDREQREQQDSFAACQGRKRDGGAEQSRGAQSRSITPAIG